MSARRLLSGDAGVTRLLSLSNRIASVVMLASFLLVLWQLLARTPLPGKPGWPEAVLVLTTAFSTILSLSRTLPGEKVLAAAVIIGLLGGAAHGLGARTALPFGPFVYAETIGPRLFDALAWPVPLLWIIAVLNSRGVARLILRPWRKLKNYGVRLISLTVLLVLLFDLALEPYAAHVNHFWLWLPTKFPYAWYGAPFVNFLGWMLVALLILVLVTPVLTQKPSRSRTNPLDYSPLIVWLLAFILFTTSAFQHQLWGVAAVNVLAGLIPAIFAASGARW